MASDVTLSGFGDGAEFAYDVPGSAEMVYTTSNSSNALMSDFGEEFITKRYSNGSYNGPHTQAEFNNPTAWSSPASSSVDPSLPSSCSQGNLFPYPMDSPISFTSPEDSISIPSMHEKSFSGPVMDFPVQSPIGFAHQDPVVFDPSRFEHFQDHHNISSNQHIAQSKHHRGFIGRLS